MLIFVMFASFDWLFLSPVMKRIDEIEIKIQEQKGIVRKDKQILRYENKIMADNQLFDGYLNDTVEDINIVNADFLSLLDRLADEVDVNLSKNNAIKNGKTEQFLDYYVQLDYSGSFDKVIAFMYLINSHKSLLKVESFTMTPKRGTKNSVTVSMIVVKLVIPVIS